MAKSSNVAPAAKAGGERELLSVDEASKRLRVSRAFVRKQLSVHRLTVVRFGRLLRIPPETIDQIVQIGRRPFAPHIPGGGR